MGHFLIRGPVVYRAVDLPYATRVNYLGGKIFRLSFIYLFKKFTAKHSCSARNATLNPAGLQQTFQEPMLNVDITIGREH